jgi:hypothetical protein
MTPMMGKTTVAISFSKPTKSFSAFASMLGDNRLSEVSRIEAVHFAASSPMHTRLNPTAFIGLGRNMSESTGGTGGTATKERTTKAHRLELTLLFESRDYTLGQLRTRLEDVEALTSLLTSSSAVFMSDKRRAGIQGVLQRHGSPGRSLRPYAIISKRILLAASGRKVFTEKALRGKYVPTTIKVETVSLHSPLELFLVITGSLAVIKTVTKLMPKLIAIKNDWNESRVIRAKSDLEVERLRLERDVLKLYADEFGKVDPDAFFSLPEDHPSRVVVKRAVRALSQLDKADIKS